MSESVSIQKAIFDFIKFNKEIKFSSTLISGGEENEIRIGDKIISDYSTDSELHELRDWLFAGDGHAAIQELQNPHDYAGVLQEIDGVLVLDVEFSFDSLFSSGVEVEEFKWELLPDDIKNLIGVLPKDLSSEDVELLLDYEDGKFIELELFLHTNSTRVDLLNTDSKNKKFKGYLSQTLLPSLMPSGFEDADYLRVAIEEENRFRLNATSKTKRLQLSSFP